MTRIFASLVAAGVLGLGAVGCTVKEEHVHKHPKETVIVPEKETVVVPQRETVVVPDRRVEDKDVEVNVNR